MAKRLFSIAVALGMIIGLMAGVVGSASAEQVPGSGVNNIYFPWVPNGETLNGTGKWYGSVTIQNLENYPINVKFGQTSDGVATSQAFIVSAHAASTFSAAELDLPDPGAGVIASASWVIDSAPKQICPTRRSGTLTVQRDDDVANTTLTKTADQDIVAALPANGSIIKVTGNQYTLGTDYTINGNEITWISSNRPAENSLYKVAYNSGDCNYGPAIAGVEKQAAPADDGFGVTTSSANLSVDGYSAIPDTDVAWGANSKFCVDSRELSGAGNCNNAGLMISQLSDFSNLDIGWDGHSYLPIAQGNWSGWDTIIHITNVDASVPVSTSGTSYTQVTATFYSQGQGQGNQAVGAVQKSVGQGQTITLDMNDLLSAWGVKSFVGSVWITSDYGVVATATRVKASTNMAMTNTSAPSLAATTSVSDEVLAKQLGIQPFIDPSGSFPGSVTTYDMYAPLVYKDYNGWNTGINIANISEVENQVTVQFFSRDGTSMGLDTVAIPPKGMNYVYIPASQDQGLGNGDFGSAIISGQLPFYATVDEVKYSTGEAMSYVASAATAQKCRRADDKAFDCLSLSGNTLSLPLFQNGHNVVGVEHGDTSGINLFNPGNKTATGTVLFYGLDGTLQTPSNIGTVPFSVASHSTGLIYAPSMAQMTPGIQLTAVVTVDKGQIAGVSNNVNYDVNGDGGVVFQMFNHLGNYRFMCSQASCGFNVVTPDGNIFLLPPTSSGGAANP